MLSIHNGRDLNTCMAWEAGYSIRCSQSLIMPRVQIQLLAYETDAIKSKFVVVVFPGFLPRLMVTIYTQIGISHFVCRFFSAIVVPRELREETDVPEENTEQLARKLNGRFESLTSISKRQPTVVAQCLQCRHLTPELNAWAVRA